MVCRYTSQKFNLSFVNEKTCMNLLVVCISARVREECAAQELSAFILFSQLGAEKSHPGDGNDGPA